LVPFTGGPAEAKLFRLAQIFRGVGGAKLGWYRSIMVSAPRGLRAIWKRKSGYLVAKRAIDFLISAALLAILAPAFVAISLIIKADGGPVFFKHRRIGLRNRPFDCIKFRTMQPDAEAGLQRILLENPQARAEWERSAKLREDPRVTRPGRFLRRWGLDEIPQLLNVLKGEMSLVGPRPVPEEELPRYGELMADYLSVRPGITGLWQVSGGAIDYQDRVRIDSHYIRTAGLFGDLAILIRTPRALYRRVAPPRRT
jgi:lipopolysaccharide/colanic/teichoic acid biosynthesis glycosyltransferase